MEITAKEFQKLKEALLEFHIETCSHCEGSGMQYPPEEHCNDACHICGGAGREIRGGWSPDVEEAQGIIRKIIERNK